MGHTMAVWRTLEDLLIALRKKGIQISPEILKDLRAARSMIDLICSENFNEQTVIKAETYTATVEAYLISNAQKVFESTEVDEWLRRLKDASLQQISTKENPANVVADRFVLGVSRDKKWVRIKTDNIISEEYVLKLAEKWHLTVNKQTDERLMVYGQLNDVKAFVKQIIVKPDRC
ncbi:MAG: DUF2096 family protein [Nitrososphaerota archaeon]|jgi:hypothetical protein|nr:DUF2096 family protein [Nitrososphaerota archaeon]